MAASPPPTKRQKTSSSAPYELIYWPTIPGRGEPIRLCFEATKTPYVDVSNSTKAGVKAVMEQISEENKGHGYNLPHLAPPIFRHGDLIISQLPNILLYIAPKLGLAGDEEDEHAIYRINQLALTVLDGFSNEVHDTHHPMAVSEVYEDQKDEAEKKAKNYIENRLPKFLGYFERALESGASGGGEWLYGNRLTYADLVLWHGLDGTSFAFPKAVVRTRESGHYEKVWALYERVKELDAIKSYLGSERRLGYTKGIYRYYPELDIEAE
ncbi:uncharacterized protein KY384_005218 [Bacidia gigantensis]|uniref:uncharacterized protein n=1 Tax=Bacidia gigantensis TaxID=2732470 RepID=UPI001D04E890|nr:uncharacterized protein KY384_005218 [Bacidia gigantensis]KAG8529737.1 hypothetical protein KY384_005218 [Bacidia gigantensis]